MSTRNDVLVVGGIELGAGERFDEVLSRWIDQLSSTIGSVLITSVTVEGVEVDLHRRLDRRRRARVAALGEEARELLGEEGRAAGLLGDEQGLCFCVPEFEPAAMAELEGFTLEILLMCLCPLQAVDNYAPSAGEKRSLEGASCRTGSA